jgi:hypothetical protein
MKTVQETAKEISEVIESKVRDNGITFVTIDYDKLEDGERLRDAVREAHGSSLPNDYIYGVVCDFIQYVAENFETDSYHDDREIISEFTEHYTDIYNADLLDWCKEHWEWIDSSIEVLGKPDGNFIELLAQGQWHQVFSISQTIFDFLETETQN